MGKVKDKRTDNDYQLTAFYGIESTAPTTAMTICKSQPFLALPKTKMTLMELKLFDIYLGKINPKDPTVTKVVFTKAELCKVLGVDKINNEDLKRCLKTLMSSIVEVKGIGRNGKSRTSLISLLSVADINYDDAHYGNVATVELECSERAKQFIYNVEAVGYLRMNLAKVLSFDNRNPYALYQYINQNRFRGHWEVDVEDLKEYLGIPGKYNDFDNLERRVLRPCKKEIEEKTDLRYRYEKIRVGRRIQKIKFTILKKDSPVIDTDDLIELDCLTDDQDDDWSVPFN